MGVEGVGMNSGAVTGFQGGGSYSQGALDTMGNDQLLNVMKNGSEVDKKNAMNELLERISAGGSEKAGGGEKSGGGGEVDDELKKILEKLLRGEKLTPEEEMKLLGAMAGQQEGSNEI